jgi:hypothetical protein
VQIPEVADLTSRRSLAKSSAATSELGQGIDIALRSPNAASTFVPQSPTVQEIAKDCVKDWLLALAGAVGRRELSEDCFCDVVLERHRWQLRGF